MAKPQLNVSKSGEFKMNGKFGQVGIGIVVQYFPT